MGLKQLIKIATKVTCHTLTSSSEKVVQEGIIERSLSDRRLIFYIKREKNVREKNQERKM